MDTWRTRSPERLSDGAWNATLTRVRGEFSEMPDMRLSADDAESLFGLRSPVSTWVLEKLEGEGYLSRTPEGTFMRRHDAP